MLTGNRYRLTAATLAIDSSGEKRIAVTIMEGEIIEVTIPAGETIEVIGGRILDQRMLDVRWNDQVLMMFVEDVKRCHEITEP